ncbi:unnamed protein product [Calypogeia fissa]
MDQQRAAFETVGVRRRGRGPDSSLRDKKAHLAKTEREAKRQLVTSTGGRMLTHWAGIQLQRRSPSRGAVKNKVVKIEGVERANSEREPDLGISPSQDRHLGLAEMDSKKRKRSVELLDGMKRAKTRLATGKKVESMAMGVLEGCKPHSMAEPRMKTAPSEILEGKGKGKLEAEAARPAQGNSVARPRRAKVTRSQPVDGTIELKKEPAKWPATPKNAPVKTVGPKLLRVAEAVYGETRGPSHEGFCKAQGLDEFVNLKWEITKFTDQEVLDLCRAWAPSRLVQQWHGKKVRVDFPALCHIFKLKTGGEKITQRIHKDWNAKSFGEQMAGESERGYKIVQCTSKQIKQRLEFMTHALHVTKPRFEYPRYMVKLAEEWQGQRKNWAAFFHAGFVTAVKRASRVVKNNEELDVELATHIRILLAGQSSLEKVPSPVTPTRKGKGKAARLPAKEQENSEDDSFEEPVPVPTQKKMEGQRRSNRRQLGKEEKVGREMDSKNRYPGKKGDPAGKSSKRSVVIETESSEEEESESTEEVEVPISRRPLMKKRNGIRVISQREEIAPSSPEESLNDETTEEYLKPAADSDQEIEAVGLDEGQDESNQETSEESESKMNGETDDSEAEGDSDKGEEPVAELECKKTLTEGKSLAQEERLTSVESDSEKGRVLMAAGNKADQGDSHTGLKKLGRDLVEEAKLDDLEAHKKDLSPEFSKLEKHVVEETLGDLLRKKSAVWKEECQSVMGAQIEGFITHVLDEVTQGGQLTVLTKDDGKKQSKKENSPGEGRVDKETTRERDALEKLMESLGMKTKDLEVTQSEMASWWGKVATVVQDVVTENQKLKMEMQQPTCQEKPKEMQEGPMQERSKSKIQNLEAGNLLKELEVNGPELVIAGTAI